MIEFSMSALLLVALLFLAAYFFPRRNTTHETPKLFFPELNGFPQTDSIRVKFAYLPKTFFVISLGCFLLAFLDPHQKISLPQQSTPFSPLPPKEGIAIYLIVDQSGSMQEQITVRGETGKMEKATKLTLLKNVTSEFVKNRPNDLIGLIAFARAATVLSPLTLEHQVILNALKQLQVIQDPELDGTSIGYAIFKAINLIMATRHFSQELQKENKPYYDIKNSIIIVVTDGLQDPSRLDYGNALRTMEPEDAATFATQQGIRLYIVNIEPSFNTSKYLPERHVMERTAEKTGGKFYLLDDQTSLQSIFQEIDQLEKSRIIQTLSSHAFERISYYPYLIGLGLFFLFLACFLETTWLRRVP